MAITKRAHKSTKGCPNHKSQLKGSDPELVEILDNFAF